MKEKEAWPGAGFNLDFAHLSENDFDVVKKHLESLSDIETKIFVLSRILIECNYHQDIYSKRSFGRFDTPFRVFVQFRDQCSELRSKLRKIQELDRHFELSKTKKTDQVPENSNLNSEFTTARQVWAIHFLLEASGLSRDRVEKTEVARFIEFLTGKNFDNIYKRVRNLHSVSEESSQKDLDFVREYFNKLGLTSIVKKIDQETKEF
ncbi:MAG TPA: hypothetical protein VEF04_01660 [Blastocatellia bacterium]|nr:hypothetical protein [Blastocatellia bacterium]